MSIDLDDIEARIATGIYGDDRMSKEERDDAFSALAEVIAEVECLRAEVTELRALGVSLHKAAAAGRDAECAAVLRWLRRWDANVYPSWVAEADAIERGEHRREEGR